MNPIINTLITSKVSFLLICCLLIGSYSLTAQNISINADGSAPDSSAMLDVIATDKGLLIPRMTEIQKNAISGPATALTIFQTDGTSGFYFNAGTPAAPSWIRLETSEDNTSSIEDEDGDTQIQTEKFANEDIIRFDAGGTEVLRIDSKSRLNLINAHSSIFIGQDAGSSINAGTSNSFLGYQAGSTNSNGSNNTFVGYQSGKANGFESGNTFIGSLSGTANNGGLNNTFMGYNSGSSNTTGDENTFLGQSSGQANNGKGNVFLGFNAGAQQTAASDLLFIENSNSNTPLIYGDFAADSLVINGKLTVDPRANGTGYTFPGLRGTNGQVLQTDGSGTLAWSSVPVPAIMQDADGNTKIQVEEGTDDDIIRFDLSGTEFFRMNAGRLEVLNTGGNLFLGEGAGENSSLTDNNNIGIGLNALQNNTSNTNLAIGNNALRNTTSFENTAIGHGALEANDNGFLNIALGGQSLNDNDDGYENTAVGYNAMTKNISGAANTVMGNGAFYNNTTGDYNVAIGAYSGEFVNGSNNIFIGTSAGAQSSLKTFSDKLFIENSNSSTPLIYGDFANDSVKIYGKLSIGSNYTFPTIAPTSGQVLRHNGTGLEWGTDATDGDGIFSGSGSVDNNTTVSIGLDTLSFTSSVTNGFSVDGSTFSVDGASNYVGIGTTNPTNVLSIVLDETENNGISISDPSNSIAYLGDDIYSGQENGVLYLYDNAGVNAIKLATKSGSNNWINNAANFGVGTTNPDSLLDVAGGAEIDRLSINGLYSFPTDAPSTNEILKYNGTEVEWGLASTPTLITDADGDTYVEVEANSDDDTLRFFTAGSQNMTVTPSGNVGIGTSTPSQALHIKVDSEPQLLIEPSSGLAQNAGITIRGARNNSNTQHPAQLHFQNYDDDITSTNFMGSIVGRITNVLTNKGDLLFLNYADGSTESEAMRITSDGNVGIGTTAPESPLHIKGGYLTIEEQSKSVIFNSDIAGRNILSIRADTALNNGAGINLYGTNDNLYSDQIRFYTQNSFANPNMLIDSSGRVAIGTESPSGKLTIAGTGEVAARINSYASTLSENASLAFSKARGSEGSETAVANNDIVGQVTAFAHDGTMYGASAKISIEMDGAPASGDLPGRIQFHTTEAGSSTTTERMRIDSDGNVGIGLEDPSSILDVAGDIETGSTDAFYFGDPDTNGSWRIIRDGDDLSFERRESGSWVFKVKMNP